MAYLVAVGTACFALGLAAGMLLGYLSTRASITERLILIEQIIKMKRQGFVPQFEFEQKKTHDPSEDVVEF